MSTTLAPGITNPIYVVTPPYTRLSAGIVTLHLLCHYLNRAGHLAYIINHPFSMLPDRALPNYISIQDSGEYSGLIAPHVTQETLDFYDQNEITPIVIYPEVYDNPFQASFFGRYVLNYPGLIAPAYTEREDFSVYYSRILANSVDSGSRTKKQADVLFMPTCDLEFWTEDSRVSRLAGTSSFYAGKLKSVHGEPADRHPVNAIEILRSTSMSREQVRDIFRRSSAFYCYEDTALAIEARLCGCPVILVPNKHFSGRLLAEVETGSLGSCIIDEPGGLEHATESVSGFRTSIEGNIVESIGQIDLLAKNWKFLVGKRRFTGGLTLGLQPRMVLLRGRVGRVLDFEIDPTTRATIAVNVREPAITDIRHPTPSGGIPERLRYRAKAPVHNLFISVRRGLWRIRRDPSDYGIAFQKIPEKRRFPRDQLRAIRRNLRKFFGTPRLPPDRTTSSLQVSNQERSKDSSQTGSN